MDRLEVSLAFYRDGLGFAVDFVYEGFYASVSRDGRDVDAWAGRGRSFARPDIRLAPSETAWKNRSNAKIPIKQPALPSVDR